MGKIVRSCGAAGLKHACMTAFSDAAALKIVDVAEQEGCDLIFMGSHGRSGWGQLLLGSVTNKVLSHTTRPVLVHRLINEPAPGRKTRQIRYAAGPGRASLHGYASHSWRGCHDPHCYCRRPHDHA